MISNQASTPESLLEDSRRYLPGGVLHNMVVPVDDFMVSHGEGAYLYTVDGRKYIDHLLGSGSNILGHSHPSVVRAVQEQITKGTNFYTVHPKAVELAKVICEAVPCGEKIRFASSGTEATYFALRLARAFTGKQKVLKFEGAYHGFHDYVMQSSQFAPTSALKEYPYPAIDTAGIPDIVAQTVLIAPYNNAEITKNIISNNEREIACVLVEPFQRTIPPKDGFLQELREITEQMQIILIFDEVVTGFRFAYGGAQEYYGVKPDLATYAKTIGGGFPCGAVVGRSDIMDLCDPNSSDRRKIFWTGTYHGNPVTSVAGLATLKELRKEQTYHDLNLYGTKLREGLKEIFERQKIAAQVHGDASVQDFTITDKEVVDFRSELTGNLDVKKKIRSQVIAKGIFAPYKLYVSTRHRSKELDTTLRAYEEAISEVRGKYL